jgi:hypothetical protein
MCVSGPYAKYPHAHFCRGSEKAHVTRRLSARITVLFAAACLSIPTVGIAQQGGGSADSGWWDWALPKIQIQIGDDDAGKQQGKDKGKSSGAKAAQGNAGKDKGVPAFCRSGAGHPVHGWQWCVERSYKMGWSSTALSGAEFRGRDKARRGAELDAGSIDEILGNEIMKQLRGVARDLGLDGAINGRWADTDDGGALVLQLRVGNEPLAELTDRNGNGKVDAALLMGGE